MVHHLAHKISVDVLFFINHQLFYTILQHFLEIRNHCVENDKVKLAQYTIHTVIIVIIILIKSNPSLKRRAVTQYSAVVVKQAALLSKKKNSEPPLLRIHVQRG
jgi:hypothetical protein